MAKVNSKYFADIIAKLLETKRMESIVIDESFKNEFRVKFLARAAEIGGVATVAADEILANDVSLRDELNGAVVDDDFEYEELPDRAPIDWRGMVRRFRYVLALVPSALLVVFVSSYVMNLPVELGSEVVVPRVVDEVNVDDAKPLFTSEDSVGEGDVVVGEDVGEVVGEDVGVVVGEDVGVVVGEDAVVDEGLAEEWTEDSSMDSTSSQTGDSEVPTVPAYMFRPIGQQVSDQPQGTTEVDNYKNPTEDVAPYAQPVTPQGAPLVESLDVPQVAPVTPYQYFPQGATQVPSKYVPQEVDSQDVPAVEESQKVYQDDVVHKVETVPQVIQSAPVPVTPTAPYTMPDAQLKSDVLGEGSSGGSTVVKSAPVYYYTNLNSVEKKSLEGRIINTFDQSDVMEMHVFSLSGDVLEVVVRFNDGTAITKNLRKIGESGSFDDVSSIVGEEKAALEPVVIPQDYARPTSVPSGFFGPIHYEVLLDYDKSR